MQYGRRYEVVGGTGRHEVQGVRRMAYEPRPSLGGVRGTLSRKPSVARRGWSASPVMAVERSTEGPEPPASDPAGTCTTSYSLRRPFQFLLPKSTKLVNLQREEYVQGGFFNYPPEFV